MRSAFRRGAILPLILSLVAIVAVLVSPLGVQDAKADNLYASIRGRVADQSGAAIPGATVKATHVSTGTVTSTTSRDDGTFVFLQLAIGNYKVVVEKAGFSTYTAGGIHLDLNEVFNLNVAMQLGAVTQEVRVEANVAQVETSTTQLGTVIDSNLVVNLPLIGRNWVNLQQLVPGVQAASDGRGEFATNGSQSQQNSFLIDGTDTNDLPLNTRLIVPSPDAIAEFRLVTGSINPEYGRNSGAVVNATTKSGTSSFHGDIFDFYRDTFLNARNYFAKKPQVFHQNQFGGTVGGPVIKKHTFFFFSYQGIRARQPQAGGNAPVYPSTELNVANLGAGATDPVIATSANVSPIPLTGSDGVAYAAMTPYKTIFGCNGGMTPNCVVGFIPGSDFNTISKNLITKFVPAPNAGGTNFQFSPITNAKADQYIVRVDHTFNSKDTIWGTWFIQHSPSTDALPFTGSDLPGFPEVADRHLKFLTLDWSHVLNSHMVNELRGGYTRFNFVAVEPVNPTQPSTFGFATIHPQLASGAQLPIIDLTGSGLFIIGFSNNGPQPRIDQTYETVDNFSWLEGKHTLKFGFDMRRFEVLNPFAFSNNGSFSFAGTGQFSTGDGGADFLLGIPDSFGQGSGGTIDARAQEYYSYAQDQYKFRPNFTITYGVGWQIDTPISDIANNNHAAFAFRQGQQSVVFPNAPRGYVFQGDPGVHATGVAHTFRNFGPRLGFAYSPNWGWLSGGPGKMSIRGGFGIYYNRSEEEQTLQFLGGPPFTISSVGAGSLAAPNGSPSFADPYTSIVAGGGAVANPFPFAGPAANVDFTPFLPLYQGLAGADPDTTDPMSENYNLTIERELPGQTILSVSYVGAVAHHLTVGVPVNLATNVQPCAADPACSVDNQLFTHPGDFLFPANIYGTIDQISTIGSSNYNSLQVGVNKHLSHGLQFQVSYTYSHALDDGSGFENTSFGGGGFGGFAAIRAINPYNRRASYGNSIFDASQRLVMSYVYTIPGVGSSPFVSRLTHGWTIAGITTFQGGFPLDVIASKNTSLTCQSAIQDFACPDGPNFVGPVHYMDPRNTPGVNQYFNKNAFVAAPLPSAVNASTPASLLATLGNAGRNLLTGPGFQNWDFQLFKDTQITEGTRIELRIEFYNLFNHTQFNPNGISTNFNSSRFGRETTAFSPRLIQLAAKFYF